MDPDPQQNHRIAPAASVIDPFYEIQKRILFHHYSTRKVSSSPRDSNSQQFEFQGRVPLFPAAVQITQREPLQLEYSSHPDEAPTVRTTIEQLNSPV